MRIPENNRTRSMTFMGAAIFLSGAGVTLSPLLIRSEPTPYSAVSSLALMIFGGIVLATNRSNRLRHMERLRVVQEFPNEIA